LVFGTPAEDFCKCFCKKKLAAKKGEIKNEQKCAGFERVLNKSVQVLRRSEHFLSENYRVNLGCQRMDYAFSIFWVDKRGLPGAGADSGQVKRKKG
jgi:hypothetical protein